MGGGRGSSTPARVRLSPKESTVLSSSTIALAHHGSCISGHNTTNRQGKRNAGGEIRRACEAYTRNAHIPYCIETVKEMDRWIKGGPRGKGRDGARRERKARNKRGKTVWPVFTQRLPTR